MIFGRKKAEPIEQDDDIVEAAFDEDADADDVETDDDVELEDGTVRPVADNVDEWDAVDAADWREEGPFDIEEVDLDADSGKVERLDLGTLVVTPFEGMQVQLQVDQTTQQVQAAILMAGTSALEVSVFAAPAKSVMIGEIRREMLRSTIEDLHGTAEFVEGPFGTEVRRVIPMTTPDGKDAVHVSRTWMVQGPRWLLRGVLMGEAAMTEGIDGAVANFHDTFCNLVVRRDESPRIPGDLMPMTLPASLVAQ